MEGNATGGRERIPRIEPHVAENFERETNRSINHSMGWSLNKQTLPVIAAISLAAAALTLIDAPDFVRLPLGLLAVLILPGYSLGIAFFPRPGALDEIERIALAFGLSLAAIVVMALGLNYTPWGLRPTSIVLALTLLTIVATGAAWWQRRRVIQGHEHSVIQEETRREISNGKRSIPVGLARVLGLAIAAVMLTLAVPLAPTTEFFIVGSSGLAKDYPRGGQAGDPIMATVGITNRGNAKTVYRISAEAGSQVIPIVGQIEVLPGETWQDTISLFSPPDGREQDLVLKLFRNGDIEPFRLLRLRVGNLQ